MPSRPPSPPCTTPSTVPIRVTAPVAASSVLIDPSSRPEITAVPSGRKASPQGTARPVVTVLTVSSPAAVGAMVGTSVDGADSPGLADAAEEAAALEPLVLVEVVPDGAVDCCSEAEIVVSAGAAAVPEHPVTTTLRQATSPIAARCRRGTTSSIAEAQPAAVALLELPWSGAGPAQVSSRQPCCRRDRPTATRPGCCRRR